MDLDELLVPGDTGVVGAVRRLVDALPLSTEEEVAQAALAGELAAMCAAGSVPAARELRLVLLEMRAVRDAGFEGPVSQATALRIMLEAIGTHVGEGSLDRPTPPGWRSTAEDGEVLAYLGRRWYELRDAGDVEGLADLERWVGAHSSEITCLRRMGRWSTWPDARDSL